MNPSRVMSGEDRSFAAAAVRGATALAEPVYAGVMWARNALYDRVILRSHRLPRPTISVGNITTGGTGKTPMVRWIAEQLAAKGKHVAILLRGYGGDEARMYRDWLGDRANVVANPDRVAGARVALAQSPPTDVFVLDDAFQHRRVSRDFDLVLIDATEPFGFGHVLPRGLLREPVAGLSRASAFVITRSDQVDAESLRAIEQRLPAKPIYHARHEHAGLREFDGQLLPMDELSRRRFLVFCGIGNPQGLERQFRAFGSTFLGMRAFGDHHAYSARDLEQLDASGAELLVTTEKDWVKLAPIAKGKTPIVRVEMRIAFREGDDAKLLEQILNATSRAG